MKYQRTVLSNGLRVLTIPMPSLESATVMVLVGTGSRYETRQNNGITHFLEHMAFKGTEKRPSAIDISTLIDGIGGEFNAFTGKEVTGYYIKSAVGHIDLSLDVLSDMLLHSKLDQKEIDKERGVILEEINMYEDTPMRKIGDIYEKLLYGDTSMGWDIAGEKGIVKSLQREDFVKYMGNRYSASNITVVVAGGISSKKTLEKVEKYFDNMRSFDTLLYDKVEESQQKPAVFLKKKKTEQAHIAIGVRTVAVDNNDKYVLSVLSAILGGGMSSRLFHEVREKRGLAYYVRTISEHYLDCGTLVSFAGLDPKRAKDAIVVILAEYEKIANIKNQISNKELSKAKEFLKGHLVLEFEDSRSVAGFYAQQEMLEKKIENINEVLAKIDKITAGQIGEAAKKYFKEQTLNLAIIGDFESGQEFENLLKL